MSLFGMTPIKYEKDKFSIHRNISSKLKYIKVKT